MPKSNLDWLGVVSLWVGALVMAIKAGGLQLLNGAPGWLAANWWNHLPLALVSFYLIVQVYRVLRPAPTSSGDRPQPPSQELDESKQAEQASNHTGPSVVFSLMAAERAAKRAYDVPPSQRRRSAEKTLPELRAALLSAKKTLRHPNTSQY